MPVRLAKTLITSLWKGARFIGKALIAALAKDKPVVEKDKPYCIFDFFSV